MKSKLIVIVCIFWFFFSSLLKAQDADTLPATPDDSHHQYVIQTIELPDGRIIEATITPSPPTPPPGFERPVLMRSKVDQIMIVNILDEVPAFDWSFGCSATSAAMIAGYYDRHGFVDMYSGPTNGGLMPLDNSVWPDWYDGYDWRHQCPLSATRNGLDGRSTNGHVDDYWIHYGNSDPDPFIGNWPEHIYEDCTGDFMKTNQSTYGNTDASTTFYNFTNGAPLYWEDMIGYGIEDEDGGYGFKLFYESRGYTVSEMYNQYRYGYQGNTLGFTFAQYMAEIDAGRPVMIHVVGHTMVGLGYNDATSQMIIHDTWDYQQHTMTWGGSYSGMLHTGVTIVILQTPQITITNGADVSLNFTQSAPSPPQADWPLGQFSLASDVYGATFNAITVHLSGSFSGLQGTYPFRLFAANSNDFSSATAIGTDTASFAGAVTFANLEEPLPVGNRYFWVTADLSASAGGTISAVIVDALDIDLTNATISPSSTYGLLNSGEDVSLPVELSSFSASAAKGKIRLDWTTQSELNNLGFVITRSTDSSGYYTEIASYRGVATLQGQGNTNERHDYTFHDTEIISGVRYYYRLSSVDFDGATTTYGPLECTLPSKERLEMAEDGLPVSFGLMQNYPNPFNPTTIIGYRLADESTVDLSIYNLRGQKMETLVSQSQGAGYYRVVWNASGLPAGIYMYRLQTDQGYSAAKKLVLLK